MLDIDLQSSLLRAAFDSIPSHLAIVDYHGVIRMVNNSWNRFASENGALPSDIGEGLNYLKVANSCEEGAAVEAALRQVLSGESHIFIEEYPCNSPEEERWFRCTVSSFILDSARYAVVRHDDITIEHEMLLSLKSKKLELERVNADLKWLQGVIPTCSYCRRIRNDSGAWHQLESYLAAVGTAFSHGVCDDCMPRLYNDLGVSLD
jgi:hypothetical protein